MTRLTAASCRARSSWACWRARCSALQAGQFTLQPLDDGALLGREELDVEEPGGGGAEEHQGHQGRDPEQGLPLRGQPEFGAR